MTDCLVCKAQVDDDSVFCRGCIRSGELEDILSSQANDTTFFSALDQWSNEGVSVADARKRLQDQYNLSEEEAKETYRKWVTTPSDSDKTASIIELVKDGAKVYGIHLHGEDTSIGWFESVEDAIDSLDSSYRIVAEMEPSEEGVPPKPYTHDMNLDAKEPSPKTASPPDPINDPVAPAIVEDADEVLIEDLSYNGGEVEVSVVANFPGLTRQFVLEAKEDEFDPGNFEYKWGREAEGASLGDEEGSALFDYLYSQIQDLAMEEKERWRFEVQDKLREV